jgi:hypothetical protein
MGVEVHVHQIVARLWAHQWAWQLYCAFMGARFFGPPSPKNIVLGH